MSATYEIIATAGSVTGKAIKCLVCGMTSYNSNDVEQRYCGRCHRYHMDVDLPFMDRLIVDRVPDPPGEALVLECHHHVICAVPHRGMRAFCAQCLHDYLIEVRNKRRDDPRNHNPRRR